VIARVPLDEGGLTGRLTPETTFPEGDFRNEYFSGDHTLEHVDERVQAIVKDLGIEREELPETAIRYVLSHPAVSTVIPGMRTVRNVERNAALGDGEGLPAERVEALKTHRWDRS
jgi:aryl-alcohol dehydrogenase-like predicted oxidoreductase